MKNSKPSARPSRKTPTGKPARARAHGDVIARVRSAVRGALEPQALIQILWDEQQLDIDRIVDQFARTHRAEGYRDPKLQKVALDALQDRLFAALPEALRGDFNAFAQGWYSRYLLATDIGFEMGFAAAQTVVKGGGQ